MIIDSPTASETEAISTQTKTTVNRASSKARPGAPKSQSAIEDAFDEDEAVDSDGGGDPGDDDNEYLDDGDDDLKELGPGELQQQLADEVRAQIITCVTWLLLPFSSLFQVPQWTNGDDEEHEEQDEDDCVFSDDGYRASSRASFSSGHHSVPESHIEISDSDSEPDSALRAGLSGLRTAHRRVADAAVIEKFQVSHSDFVCFVKVSTYLSSPRPTRNKPGRLYPRYVMYSSPPSIHRLSNNYFVGSFAQRGGCPHIGQAPR